MGEKRGKGSRPPPHTGRDSIPWADGFVFVCFPGSFDSASRFALSLCLCLSTKHLTWGSLSFFYTPLSLSPPLFFSVPPLTIFTHTSLSSLPKNHKTGGQKGGDQLPWLSHTRTQGDRSTTTCPPFSRPLSCPPQKTTTRTRIKFFGTHIHGERRHRPPCIWMGIILFP